MGIRHLPKTSERWGMTTGIENLYDIWKKRKYHNPGRRSQMNFLFFVTENHEISDYYGCDSSNCFNVFSLGLGVNRLTMTMAAKANMKPGNSS
jgi:hypothetical protein